MYLLDVVLPFLFFELWYVLIALIFVVLIETIILRFYIKEKWIGLFLIVLKANFWTTVVGYLAQGLIRIIIGFVVFAANQNLSENKLFDSLVGNIGLGYKINKYILINLFTSIILALVISIVVERRILIKELDKDFGIRKITIGVTIANVVSYCLLFIWIYSNYLRHRI